jgi:hypothetical protein
MDFGQWLIPSIPLEEELRIEKECREAAADGGPRLAALLRLCYSQQDALQRATNEIMRLELLLMDAQNGMSSPPNASASD